MAFLHQLRAASSLMKSIVTIVFTILSWITAKACLFFSHGAPAISSNFSLNSSNLPSLSSWRSNSARYGIDPQYPCISLNTFMKTSTIASFPDPTFADPLESILKSMTSEEMVPELVILAISIGSSIFFPSVKYSMALFPSTTLFFNR
ncbi:unknown [Ruminococcus sp. CAG:90]|nr:unknown [Ruminococcus sp. CAG:90]